MEIVLNKDGETLLQMEYQREGENSQPNLNLPRENLLMSLDTKEPGESE